MFLYVRSVSNCSIHYSELDGSAIERASSGTIMSSTLLAECIAFKSKQNGKYVGYKREYKGVKKILQISEEDTFNPYTRFRAEPSIKHSGHYYHIRCYYNNKYWVPHQVNKAWYIFVDANKPEEDLSNPSCTLFRLELHGGNNYKYGFLFKLSSCWH